VIRLLTLCQPTHPADAALMARLSRIGIAPGEPFDPDAFDDDTRRAICRGVDAARAAIADQVANLSEGVNGWVSSDAFGYRDFCRGDHMLRAVGAMAGWGGNDVVEAVYPTARVDAEGELLDGSRSYRATFTTLPPANAFWSVTMCDTSYDGTAGYLVENPIGRYLINSTTEGLVSGDDGTLTIAIQHDRPDTPGRAGELAPRSGWAVLPGSADLLARSGCPRRHLGTAPCGAPVKIRQEGCLA